MIFAKFCDNGKPTTLTQEIQKGKKIQSQNYHTEIWQWKRRLQYSKS